MGQRAAIALEIAVKGSGNLLDIVLNHLILARTALYAHIADSSRQDNQQSVTGHITAAVAGLRRAGQLIMLPQGLGTRSWLRFFPGARTGIDSAQEDLGEAWEIVERGPMRLHMADIHLYRARLFHAVKPYPWNKFTDGSEGRGPKDDLDAAEDLINKCGYHRRDEELADASEAAKNWT